MCSLQYHSVCVDLIIRAILPGIATLADVGKMDAAGRDRVEAQYELVYPAAVDDVVEPTEYVA